jgi:predicted nucleic acid-binding protein
MSRFSGTIFDATAITDFHCIGEWECLERCFGPLHVSTEVLSSASLGRSEKRSAEAHLEPLPLTEEALQIAERLRVEEPGLCLGDRATLALATKRSLCCATDDDLLASICQKQGVIAMRTLALLRGLVEVGGKTPAEVIRLVHSLMRDRGKLIPPKVLHGWETSLEAVHSGVDEGELAEQIHGRR